MSFVKASIFFLAISPFSLGCPTKLMDGKDKQQNKREIVELLRKLADMLEEQDKRLPWDYPTVDTPEDIANPRWQNPNGYPKGPQRIQNGGHPPLFGIDIDNAVDRVTPVQDCPLWDDGTCGLKAAAGKGNLRFTSNGEDNFNVFTNPSFCHTKLTNFKPGDYNVRTFGRIKFLLPTIEVKGFKELKIQCSWRKWFKIPRGNGYQGGGLNPEEKL